MNIRKKWNAAKIPAAVMLFVGISMFQGRTLAAEGLTTTITKLGSVFEIQLAWTAAADGSFTERTITPGLSGLVMVAITDPGSPAPTDNYNVVLKDINGLPIFGTALDARDTANSEIVEPLIAFRPVTGAWTFDITSNSVDSATGTVKVYIMSK